MGTHAAERTARRYTPEVTSTNQPRPHGRRAAPALDSPVAAAIQPNTAGLRRVAVTTFTAGSLLAGMAGLAPVTAAPAHRATTNHESPQSEAQEEISAAADVTLASEVVKVTTAPAPVVQKVEKPAVAAQPVAQAKTQVVAESVQAPAPAAAAPAPAAPAPSGNAASIVAAAYAQIGQSQDCTMLVTRSLAAVGINFHGWPVEYYSLGYAVSAADAQPGDLIYYVNGSGASIGGMAHIAVYVGNGMAVHGGWDGWTTKLFSVNVGSGPNYIRLR